MHCAGSSEKNAGFPDFPTRSELENGWVGLEGYWDGLRGGLADEKMAVRALTVKKLSSWFRV